MKPKLKNIDHIHIFVTDRQEALKWYRTVLGLKPVKNLLFWAKTGPLTIGNEEGCVHIALFKGKPKKNRSVIAFNTTGKEFINWHKKIKNALGGNIEIEDHSVSFSIYFEDPYGNPYEITSYDYEILVNHYN
ncbi:MAG: VOC family protein, partial [Candidatus Marinimicrobia bacterium]|nr:VOC family protein [Candidatus Neomarinimicrobiota bacterium]